MKLLKSGSSEAPVQDRYPYDCGYSWHLLSNRQSYWTTEQGVLCWCLLTDCLTERKSGMTGP